MVITNVLVHILHTVHLMSLSHIVNELQTTGMFSISILPHPSHNISGDREGEGQETILRIESWDFSKCFLYKGKFITGQ